jgi:hypothetical protein
MSRSLLGKALGIRQGQVIHVRYDPDGGGVVVRGANEMVKEVVAQSVLFDHAGRLRVDPESGLLQTGAQFKLSA